MTSADTSTAVDAVRALLEPAGAPEPVALATVSALGDEAAEELGRNPWRVLSVPGVHPAAADALARSVDPRWGADDMRRGAALVGWLLTRAADAGHTVVRPGVVTSALRGYDVVDTAAAIGAALDGGGVVELGGTDLALTRWAAAEEDAARQLGRLLPAGVSAVVGARTSDESGDETLMVRDAHALGLEDAARVLATASDDAKLHLVGDPDVLPGPGPGNFFADVVSSGAVPVTDLRTDDSDITRLASAVRQGRLPAVDSPDRKVVIVPANDGSEVVRRTLQLVSDSIPRALGFAPADIQILAPRQGGFCGARALNAALAGVAPRDDAAITIHRAGSSTWPAVVLVLPGEAAGVLSRTLVYTAVTRAREHLSVVHGAGRAVAVAVAAPPRIRRTRLRTLLAGR